jgi:hypothetical protein
VFIIQSGRWYPSAVVLANGSVLVVGGENGPNGPPTPTLEILPRIPGGNTLVFLNWLQRTDPNNLYPFLHVLPSGRIFAGKFGPGWLPELTLLTHTGRLLQRGTPP